MDHFCYTDMSQLYLIDQDEQFQVAEHAFAQQSCKIYKLTCKPQLIEEEEEEKESEEEEFQNIQVQPCEQEDDSEDNTEVDLDPKIIVDWAFGAGKNFAVAAAATDEMSFGSKNISQVGSESESESSSFSSEDKPLATFFSENNQAEAIYHHNNVAVLEEH